MSLAFGGYVDLLPGCNQGPPGCTEDLSATLAPLQARALDGLFAGSLDAARSSSSEGARLSRESGDLYTLDMMLMNLGSAALIAGDITASKPRFTEALRIAHQIDDRVAQSYLCG